MFKKKNNNLKKIILKSGLFDEVFYLKQYKDVKSLIRKPLEHYLQIGLDEGRSPNALFDSVWYKEYYQDVKQDSGYPFIHYVIFGQIENRFINEKEKNDYEALVLSGLFDEEFYKNRNDDLKVQAESFDLLLHFVRLGMYEGREGNVNFDSKWYKNYYKDISTEPESPIMDYVYYGEKDNRFTNESEKDDYALLIKSTLFDEKFYKDNNLDLIEQGENFDYLLHFLRLGIREGREPNSTFDSIWYKEHNNDLKGESRLPFMHYLHYGKKEGRFANAVEINNYNILQTSTLFNEEFYKNDLSHFVRIGMYEGKEPNATFDSKWYAEYYEDIDTNTTPSIMHYIHHGEKENRFVNKSEKENYQLLQESCLFDEEFYKKNHHSLREKKEGFNFALDFIRFGMKEGKEPNSNFDSHWYKEIYLSSSNKSIILPFTHYLKFGLKENNCVNKSEKELYFKLYESKTFDAAFYKGSYKDLADKEDDFDFLLHYVRVGQSQMRKISENSEGLSEEELVDYELIKDAKLDWSFYDEDNEHLFVSKNYVYDYVKNWKEYHPTLRDFFDTDFYLDRYPDIAEIKMNPLVHYIIGGKKEGREPLFDVTNIVQGELEFEETKETIVFVSHESSASGAPLLGLNIADILVEKFNIVHIIIKKSNIHDSFLKNCDLLYSSIEDNQYGDSYIFLKRLLKERDIKAVICNSIVTSEILNAAYDLDISTLLLIHEFTDYTKPANRTMYSVFRADNVVVPATIIQDSIMEEITKNNWVASVPSNIHILPQGKLPYIPKGHGDNDSTEELYKKLNITSPKETKIIVGSGWVQIRKGIDLFIQTARQIKKSYDGSCKFVWVGGGFDPEGDLAYSVWLNRELKYSGLDEDFVFLEHQENLDAIFSISDIFCLTSRMDPFPNVVIDALSHDLHIACFDNATGSSEFLQKHDADCTIVDYVDTYQLASEIVKQLKSSPIKSGKNKKIVTEHLNFETYVNALEKLVESSIEFKKKSQEIQQALLQGGEFDSEYFGENMKESEAIRKYVETSLKGIHFKNPKAGFSQLKWITEEKLKTNSVPLYEAIKKSYNSTHNVVTVPFKHNEKIEFFYAVHVHMFYIELAEEFADYFQSLPGKFDILVTIVNEEDEKKVKEVFKNSNANDVKIMLVENIGRDSGPLYFGLKEIIKENNYEVIGHFHSKKSRDINDGLGDNWRKFLMETLIGDVDSAKSVLSLFNDKKIGLVFADDNHVVDIGQNREYLDKLCNRIKMPYINETEVFPVGNMFWVRVNAIKELFSLDQDKILEEEPLPYDGSYMHALERMTPAIVEHNGYSFKTIHKKGVRW